LNEGAVALAEPAQEPTSFNSKSNPKRGQYR
jgi:hypothetical protein